MLMNDVLLFLSMLGNLFLLVKANLNFNFDDADTNSNWNKDQSLAITLTHSLTSLSSQGVFIQEGGYLQIPIAEVLPIFGFVLVAAIPRCAGPIIILGETTNQDFVYLNEHLKYVRTINSENFVRQNDSMGIPYWDWVLFAIRIEEREVRLYLKNNNQSMKKVFFTLPPKVYSSTYCIKIQYVDPEQSNLPLIVNKIFISSSPFSARALELFNQSLSFSRRLPYLYLDSPVHLHYQFNETITNSIVTDFGVSGTHQGKLGLSCSSPSITSTYVKFEDNDCIRVVTPIPLPLTKTVAAWIYFVGKTLMFGTNTCRIFKAIGSTNTEYFAITESSFSIISQFSSYINGNTITKSMSRTLNDFDWFPVFVTEQYNGNLRSRKASIGFESIVLTDIGTFSQYDPHELMTITIGDNFIGRIRLFKILSRSYADDPKLVPGITLDEYTYSFCSSSKVLDITATCSADCSIGYYVNLNSKACNPCGDNCNFCSRSTYCMSCLPVFSIYSDSENANSCVSFCPEGYFNNGLACASCPSNCSTCGSLTECALCSSGFYLSESFTCIACPANCSICTSTGCSACDANYYLSSVFATSLCLECLSNCYFCYNFTNCDECFEGFYKVTFDNNTDACLKTCPASFYPTQNMICGHCMSGCINCTNNSACLECEDNYYKHTYTETNVQVCTPDCPEYYYGSSNKTCENCITNCVECTDFNHCVTCINEYFPVLKENGTKICVQTQCEPNQYFLNENCYYCLDNCSSCSSSADCSSCGNSTYLMHYSNNSYACIENCPEYFYEDSWVMKCISCLSHCKSCVNGTHCSNCENDYFLYRTDNFSYYECASSCPPKYYESNEGTCEHCINNCSLCNDHSSCDECIQDNYLFTTSSLSIQCLNPCPESTFVQSNKYCVQCSANCKNCINFTQCEVCKTNYFLFSHSNGTVNCLNICPIGYYSEDGLSCTTCSDYCTSCTSWTLCEACINPYFLISNASNEAYCFDTCPTGNYIDENDCLPCPQGCLDCANATYCRLCDMLIYIPTFYVDGSIVCSQNCPLGYYSNGTAYLPCDFRCISCTNPYNTDCIECDYSQAGVVQVSGTCQCQSGYSANTEKRVCETCEDSLCESCNSKNYAECLKCSSNINGLYLDSATKTCKCKDGKYRMNDNCYSCHSFCKTCTGSLSTQCVASQCTVNSYPLSSNPETCLYMCKSQDDSKYFDASTKQCKNCISPCRACSEASVCLSCISGHFLYNGQCVTTCPSKYFSEDQTCYPCDSKCTSCTKKSTYCVSSCEKPYFFHNHACLAQCPVGFVGAFQKCSSCSNGCLNCIINTDNSTTCTECMSAKFLHEGSCINICPSGYYGLDGVCQKCNLACASCYGESYKNCIECNSTLGYLKISENTCSFPSCIEGFYYNASLLKCTSCPETCTKCLNSSYCIECERGYSLNGIGECSNNCHKVGFYRDDSTFECKELCGDGRNMGMYECDDGNTKDGDGCSSKCTVENYFKCQKGDSTHPDECTETKPPKFLKFTYYKNFSAILKFSEPVLFKESLPTLFSLSVNKETAVTFTVIKISNKMLQFNLLLNISMEGGEALVLEATHINNIVDYSGNSLKDSQISSKMYKYTHESETSGAESTGKASLYVMLPSLALSLGLSLVFNTPIEGMWATISIIQMLSYMTLLQLEYPKNLLAFFEYIESVHDFNKWMPNPFNYFIDSSQLYSDAYSEQFSDRGFASRYLVFLCGADLTMLILMCLAILILLPLAPRISICSLLLSKLRYSSISRSFIQAYLKICLAAFVNISVYKFGNLTESVANVVGMLTGCCLIFFPAFASEFLYQNYELAKTDKNFKTTFSSFISDFRVRSNILNLMYYPIFLFRRVIFAAIIVVLNKYPPLQLALIYLNSFSMFLYLLLFSLIN